MKTKELRQKTDKELYSLLNESREKLRSMSFDLSAKKLKNVREISSARKTIAKILTILKQTNVQK